MLNMLFFYIQKAHKLSHFNMSPSLYRLFVPCVFIYESIMYFKAKNK